MTYKYLIKKNYRCVNLYLSASFSLKIPGPIRTIPALSFMDMQDDLPDLRD